GASPVGEELDQHRATDEVVERLRGRLAVVLELHEGQLAPDALCPCERGQEHERGDPGVEGLHANLPGIEKNMLLGRAGITSPAPAGTPGAGAGLYSLPSFFCLSQGAR